MIMKFPAIRNILLALPLLCCLGACKKFLDQQPISTATDQTGWKTDGDASAGVTSCYALLRASLNAAMTPFAYGDLPSDEFTDILNGGDAFKEVIDVNWSVSIPATNIWDPRLKLRLYTPFFTTIAQANRCLHYISAMPASAFGQDDASQQSAKDHYLGEAYFIRGFNYFYMARIWGGVPIVTDYVADISTDQPVARSTETETLHQAVADLQQASRLLDVKDNSSSDRAVRADKGMVYATLAHLYAWKGDYDSCRLYCDSVINTGSYALVDGSNYLNIYKGQSDESIFEISQNNTSEAQMLGNNIAGYTLMTPYVTGVPIPWWTVNDGVFDNLYSDTTDLRYKRAFYIVPNGSSRTISCVKYQNVKYIPTEGNSTGVGVAMNNIIIFRLADIMLLKAEALAAGTHKDEAGALTLVNNIRLRAGLTTPLTGLAGADLYSAIIAERGRELFLEGSRFYDLVRLARQTGVMKFPYISAKEFAGGKYYWPLDPSLFTLNSKLTQTPYWADKIR